MTGKTIRLVGGLRPILVFVLLTAIVGNLDARMRRSWSYDKLTEESDLIVIVTPLRVVDTGKKTTLPGIRRSTGNGKTGAISAIEMETTFQVLSVLKGKKGLGELSLSHLREEDPPEVQKNGPGLIAFDPEKKKRFLLFLKQDSSGNYLPLSGQTDPCQSVKDLGTHP